MSLIKSGGMLFIAMLMAGSLLLGADSWGHAGLFRLTWYVMGLAAIMTFLMWLAPRLRNAPGNSHRASPRPNTLHAPLNTTF